MGNSSGKKESFPKESQDGTVANVLKYFGNNLEKTSVLVVGGPGAGKTTLVHNLLQREVPDDLGVTKHTKAHKGEIEGLPMMVYDTPALHHVSSEGALSVEELCKQHQVQVIVVCIRMSAESTDDMITGILQSVFALNTPVIIALTMADHFSPRPLPIRTQLYSAPRERTRQQDKKIDFSQCVSAWKKQVDSIRKKQISSISYRKKENVSTQAAFIVLPTSGIHDSKLPTGHQWLPDFHLALLKTIAPRTTGKISYPCKGAHRDEISLQPGDMVTNIQWYKDGLWASGTCQRRTGLFHSLLLEPYNPHVEELKLQREKETVRDAPKGVTESFKEQKYTFIQSKSEIYDEDKCIICLNLAYDPVQTKCCGKTFCQPCVKKVQDRPCPHCRAKNENFTFYEDQKTARRIESYKIFCVNFLHGCDWVGELANIEDHRKKCPRQMEKCVKNCGQEYRRYLKQLHSISECPLRKVKCPFCSMTYDQKHMLDTHWEVCPNWPVRCPHLCEERHWTCGTLQSHLDQNCPKHRIPCKYKDFRCKYTTMRENMPKHEDSHEGLKTHLDLVAEKYRQSAQEVTDLKKTVANLVIKVHNLHERQT